MAGNLFIQRPKLAIVISLAIILAGIISLTTLPLEEYPSITPPQVIVNATYSGASADVITSTIAAPVELQLNGIEDMLYMTSESDDMSDLESTRGITIEKIFKDSGFDYIDILKLDIEGSEKEIFSDDSHYQSWLPYTKILIIELHDRMKRGCSRNFFRAISWYEYFFMQSGENLIFIREDLL